MDAVVSVLLGEFVTYVKSNWSAHSQAEPRRRHLRQLVSKLRAAADAGTRAAVRDESLSCWLQMLRSGATRGQEVLDDDAAIETSARGFLAGLKTLVVGSDEAERLQSAVEELERLADRDLHVFVRLCLDAAMEEEEDMDVDGRPVAGARRRRERIAIGCSGGCVGTVAALRPSRGSKRACDDGGGDDAGSTSRGEVDAVRPQKRQKRWQQRDSLRRSPCLAMSRSRSRRRVGKPTTTRHGREATLGRQFSRITL